MNAAMAFFCDGVTTPFRSAACLRNWKDTVEAMSSRLASGTSTRRLFKYENCEE